MERKVALEAKGIGIEDIAARSLLWVDNPDSIAFSYGRSIKANPFVRTVL